VRCSVVEQFVSYRYEYCIAPLADRRCGHGIEAGRERQTLDHESGQPLVT
jgi:hypothetical protein